MGQFFYVSLLEKTWHLYGSGFMVSSMLNKMQVLCGWRDHVELSTQAHVHVLFSPLMGFTHTIAESNDLGKYLFFLSFFSV